MSGNGEGAKGGWRRWVMPAKLLLAGGLLWYLLARGTLDLSQLGGLLNQPLTLLLGVGLALSIYLIGAFRWWLLLRAQGIPFTLMQAGQVTLIGGFFNLFLPGAVGGDALRMAYGIRAAPGKRTAAVLSVFVDRVLGLLAMLLMAMVAMGLNLELVLARPPLRMLAVAALTGVVALVVGSLLLVRVLQAHAWRLHQPPGEGDGLLGRLFWRLVEAVELYRLRAGWVLAGLLISLLLQGLILAIILLLARGMEIPGLGFVDYLFVSPLSMVVNSVPISPGGLGVGEAAFHQFCLWVAPVGVVAPFGTLFFAFRMVMILATLPGLPVYLFYRQEVAQVERAMGAAGAGEGALVQEPPTVGE